MNDPLATAIGAARNGDTAAFDTLVGLLGRDLRNFVGAYAVDRDQLEEVCQTTWTTAWEHLGDWEPRAPFDHWLRGIARNLLRQDLARRRRNRSSGGQEMLEQLMLDDGSEPDEVTDARLARLGGCLERLAPKARELLVARHCRDAPMAELAQRFRQPMAVLATQLWRVRATLRSCLDGAAP